MDDRGDTQAQDPRPAAGGDFAAAGADARRRGLLGEFLGFMGHHKKWWLLPILLIFAALGVLVVAGGSAAAPFIYALF